LVRGEVKRKKKEGGWEKNEAGQMCTKRGVKNKKWRARKTAKEGGGGFKQVRSQKSRMSGWGSTQSGTKQPIGRGGESCLGEKGTKSTRCYGSGTEKSKQVV